MLTHAGDDTVYGQACEAVVNGLRDAARVAAGPPHWFAVVSHESRVLLFGDVDVEAGV